jgi:predicted outer membrane repeat protein
MNVPRFDTLTRLLGKTPSRRVLLPLLGNLLAAPLLGLGPTDAKKKKKNKATLCLDGQTIQASKRKKRKLLKRGATLGECPPPPGCTPTCAANACSGDNGCGGVCGCAAGFLCHAGVCQTCSVICDSSGTACGDALKTVLAGGGTVYACPGRYVGNFTVGNGALIGAGQGDNPATSTILDASGNGVVVFVAPTIVAALHGLRLTGGNVPASAGGGINNNGTVTATSCTVDQNHSGIAGGGIAHVSGGKLTLNACTVSRNTSPGDGGGIYTFGGAMTIMGTAINGNKGKNGGGLYIQHPATFDSACSITGNTASGTGGGIHSAAGAVTLGGATVSGNTPNNCHNVAGC